VGNFYKFDKKVIMKSIIQNSIKENKEQFLNKLQGIAIKLSVSPDWLLAIMFHESGMDSRIQNSIGATGLIQFMPATIKGLGTDSASLVSMSNVEQLDYVYKYYKPYAGRFKSAYDLFAYSFMPIAVGKPDDWVFETRKLPASLIAKQNKIFDLNKDGKITIAEYKAYLKVWFDKYEIDPL